MTHSLPENATAAAVVGVDTEAAAPAPPRRLSRLYVTLPAANIALYLLWLGVGGFLLPIQVAQITGTNDTSALSTASTTGRFSRRSATRSSGNFPIARGPASAAGRRGSFSVRCSAHWP
ncbi:hypothetical protein ACFQ0Q_40350 [Streptomyces aureus]